MIPALIALFLILSGGGSAPFADLIKQFNSASKDAIVEPARRDAAREALKQMSSAIKEHEKERDRSIKALLDLGESYAATGAEFQAVFDARLTQDTAFQEKIATLYGELKSQVTAQEWHMIVADKK